MRTTTALFFVIASLFLAVRAEATQYSFTDLGTLGGQWSEGYDINSFGDTTGTASITAPSPSYRAFLYTNNKMTNLIPSTVYPDPMGITGVGYGINDNGQVVGDYSYPGASRCAFLWSGNQFTNLSNFFSYPTSATAINNTGHIVVNELAPNGSYHCYTCDTAGNKSEIQKPIPFQSMWGYDINESGQVSGYISTTDGTYQACLTSGGTAIDIGTPNGCVSSYGFKINNLGQVVGSGTKAGSSYSQAFLFSSGAMTFLPTLSGYPRGFARGINNVGGIVGNVYTSNYSDSRAVIYQNGLVTDLNTLVVVPGWKLITAHSINDAGQIVGTCLDSSGNCNHAFLLTPIPEPTTLALLVMGAIGLIAYGWRRGKAHQIVVCFLALLVSTVGMARAVTIETVPVGNINNAADSNTGNLYGSVDHVYNIGTYEVTAGQYCEFLNAKAKTDTYGLYNAYMWSNPYGCKILQTGGSGSYIYSVAADYADRPVNYVSFWDAARFTNWLCNGQGVSADTETGAYTLTPAGIDANTVTKNASASWWIPSENEWYKAAYNNGGSTATDYYLYPTCSNTAPDHDMADLSGNNANCYGNGAPFPIDSGKYTTVKGEFQNSDSPYGTFDQGGNVFEWNDSILYSSARGIRGGSFYYSAYALSSNNRGYYNSPTYENGLIGFRVASVPEPGSLAMLLSIAVGGLIFWRRR